MYSVLKRFTFLFTPRLALHKGLIPSFRGRHLFHAALFYICNVLIRKTTVRYIFKQEKMRLEKEISPKWSFVSRHSQSLL